MKHTVALGLIIAVAVAVPAMLAGKGNAAAGKTIYTKRCATCHGATGEGKEAIAKMMKVQLRHLGAKEVQAKSDPELKKMVTEGTGKMKPVKGLSAQELSDLVAFLRSLEKK